MAGRAASLPLAAALLVAGCAVAKLPSTIALRDQTPTQQRLDAIDCKAEMGYRTNYNGDESPLANFFRNVFVLGTGGAALGGVATGLSPAASASTSEGLIAGGGAGSLAGGGIGVGGHRRFERAWIACMESRGYRVVATPEGID